MKRIAKRLRFKSPNLLKLAISQREALDGHVFSSVQVALGSRSARLTQYGADGRLLGEQCSKTPTVSHPIPSEDDDFRSEALHGHVCVPRGLFWVRAMTV